MRFPLISIWLQFFFLLIFISKDELTASDYVQMYDEKEKKNTKIALSWIEVGNYDIAFYFQCLITSLYKYSVCNSVIRCLWKVYIEYKRK